MIQNLQPRVCKSYFTNVEKINKSVQKHSGVSCEHLNLSNFHSARYQTIGFAGLKESLPVKFDNVDLATNSGSVTASISTAMAKDPFGRQNYPAIVMQSEGNRIGVLCYKVNKNIFEIQSLSNESNGEVKGVGKTLVNSAIKLAKNNGCKKIQLVARQDRHVHPEPFYRSVFGFRPIDPSENRLEKMRKSDNGLLHGSLPVKMELDLTRPIRRGRELSRLEKLAVDKQNACARGETTLANNIEHEIFTIQNPTYVEKQNNASQCTNKSLGNEKSNVITNLDEIPFVY